MSIQCNNNVFAAEQPYAIISPSGEGEVCRKQLDITCIEGRILIRTGGEARAVSEAKWRISY
jgi:hypothetical protein